MRRTTILALALCLAPPALHAGDAAAPDPRVASLMAGLVMSEREGWMLDYLFAHQKPEIAAALARLSGYDTETFRATARQGYAQRAETLGVVDARAFPDKALRGEAGGWRWAMVPVLTTYEYVGTGKRFTICANWLAYGDGTRWYLEQLSDFATRDALRKGVPALADAPLGTRPACGDALIG
ncbi:MAG: hypothetical protein GC146_03705 [Limimaricola sp.]|uniref:hypothetical protein n=1 Tax=Limimaricola sp. TaxID=2211665 RepID=UPI001DFE09DE|nr:hypothetical protein [Limimaricola sp.]MBI1416306.1 hypothetical protein [Limimaricola sp.]